MHRSFVILVTAMLGLAIAPFGQAPAAASCVGPSLTSSTTWERGATMTVEGSYFVNGCRDTGSCSSDAFGCDSCTYDTVSPREQVGLRLVQGDRTWDLGRADASIPESGPHGQVTWTFVVPSDARPGPAELTADDAQPLGVVVR